MIGQPESQVLWKNSTVQLTTSQQAGHFGSLAREPTSSAVSHLFWAPGNDMTAASVLLASHSQAVLPLFTLLFPSIIGPAALPGSALAPFLQLQPRKLSIGFLSPRLHMLACPHVCRTASLYQCRRGEVKHLVQPRVRLTSLPILLHRNPNAILALCLLQSGAPAALR